MIEKLKQKMKTAGITAYRLSKMSGVPEGTISKIMNGKSDPRLSTYEKLIKALD